LTFLTIVVKGKDSENIQSMVATSRLDTKFRPNVNTSIDFKLF